jgi:S1-C subfamily serine protease
MRRAAGYFLVAGLSVAFTYAVLSRKPVVESGESTALAAPPQAVSVPEVSHGAGVVQPPAALPDISPVEQTNVYVYQHANRSVVNVTTRSVQADDFLFLSVPREGSGSGSVLDKQGHILTNYHVIEDARQIHVTLFDSSNYPAQLVGSDPNNDLAVLRIKAPPDKLFPLPWGDSAKLQVGLRVFAIGNPFGLERTLTTGIVSSLNRSLRSENNRMIRGIIQTDAAINPGNSGGPLLNRHGELIGITTAIVSRAGQSSGVGLAIPANPARRIADELTRFGRVIRPDCGIFSVYEVEKGLLIARLVPDGPAERAGLRGPQIRVAQRGGFEYRWVDRSKADLVIAVDGRAISTLDDLLSYVESKKVGDHVTLTILREGKRQNVDIELEQARN